jgi:hypothetical protein
MTSALVHTIVSEDQLPVAAKRRLFDEATTLLAEAEKLNGTREDVTVIEARMGWLRVSADQFEPDATRAAAQRAESERLSQRAIAIYQKQAPVKR